MSRPLQMILIGLIVVTFGSVAMIGCGIGQTVSTSPSVVTSTTVSPVTSTAVTQAITTSTSFTTLTTETPEKSTTSTTITGAAEGLPPLYKLTDRGDFFRVTPVFEDDDYVDGGYRHYGYTWVYASQFGNVECSLAQTTYFEDANKLHEVGNATVPDSFLLVRVASKGNNVSREDLQSVADELAEYFAN